MLENYPPSKALAPYIRRHYVYRAELPADMVIADKMIAETAFIRIPLRGDWFVKSESDEWVSAWGPKLFGANSHPFPLKVVGPFVILGCSIKPSGWKSLCKRSAAHFVDRMVALEDVLGDIAHEMMAKLDVGLSDAEMVAAIEEAIAAQIARINLRQEDMQMAKFDAIARVDSTIRIDDAAEQVGLSVRQLERRCLESFGLTPKTILRRSRFLDMATAMRGFSDPSEEELAALRYFDQSHLNREFRRFFGMTPKAFQNAYTPLMTSGLHLRGMGEVLFNQS
jgi:AraC-like DNA-binding protein